MQWPFSYQCGVKKLSSSQIIQILSQSGSCPTCETSHPPSGTCLSTFRNGSTKACKKGCLHDGIPLNRVTCKDHNKTPSTTISKVGSDKCIPMVETVMVNSAPLDIQYDTGCQLSLINLSALKLLLKNSYTLGNTAQINLLAYDGMGKTLTATEVVLHLDKLALKKIPVDTILSSGSAFTFPTPPQVEKTHMMSPLIPVQCLFYHHHLIPVGVQVNSVHVKTMAILDLQTQLFLTHPLKKYYPRWPRKNGSRRSLQATW